MTHQERFQYALHKALPVMISYVFIGLAYGILMQEAGFDFLLTLGISLTVYTGAFQFVLIDFLKDGVSLLTVAFTALFMSSRQTFYGLTFLDDFNQMKEKRMYMIHSLTDETYAVNCSLLEEKNLTKEDRREVMFFVAILSHLTWSLFSAFGCLFGSIIPFDTTGIDFCMTALFVTILIDQWKATTDHIPAITGLSVAILCCVIFGIDRMMLPSLAIVSGILLMRRTFEKGEKA